MDKFFSEEIRDILGFRSWDVLTHENRDSNLFNNYSEIFIKGFWDSPFGVRGVNDAGGKEMLEVFASPQTDFRLGEKD